MKKLTEAEAKKLQPGDRVVVRAFIKREKDRTFKSWLIKAIITATDHRGAHVAPIDAEFLEAAPRQGREVYRSYKEILKLVAHPREIFQKCV